MTPHTPGPWRTTGPNVRTDTDQGTGALVATVKDHFADTETPEAEKAANARLIAAAPYLLAALREIVMHWESMRRGGEMGKIKSKDTEMRLIGRVAREAIAKAEEGE